MLQEEISDVADDRPLLRVSLLKIHQKGRVDADDGFQIPEDVFKVGLGELGGSNNFLQGLDESLWGRRNEKEP